MSIQTYKTAGGKRRYKVRWWDGTRHPSRSFDRKSDAEAFETEIRRRRQAGELDSLVWSERCLTEFVEHWFEHYGRDHLAASTLDSYEYYWRRRVEPALGHVRLRALSVDKVQELVASLRAEGVGVHSQRRSLVVLQSILSRAVEWGWMRQNPVANVRKPRATDARRPKREIGVREVEALRSWFLLSQDAESVVLSGLIAYAGLRPGEALGLQWEKVRESGLWIDQAVSKGRAKSTKTGKARHVRPLEPLAVDLEAYRAEKLDPVNGLIFARPDGSPWTADDWNNWRNRRFRSAANAVGINNGDVPRLRPYDLRHTFCSLLLHEGRPVHEVAAQAGHSPLMTLETYAHVIQDLSGRQINAEDEIWSARDKAGLSTVPRMYPAGAGKSDSGAQEPLRDGKPTPGLEPGTPSLRVARSECG